MNARPDLADTVRKVWRSRFSATGVARLPDGGRRRRNNRILPTLAAAALLTVSATAERSMAEPRADVGSHSQVAVWTDVGAASRIVAGTDGLIHVLNGTTVRHTRTDGSLDSQTPVSAVREIAVTGTGGLVGMREKEVVWLQRNTGNLGWRNVVMGDIHGLLGERPPYLAAVAWNPVADETTLVYDKWDTDVIVSLLSRFQPDGREGMGHALANRTHSYWDLDYEGDLELVLNRATQGVERYRNGTLVDVVPLPAPAERIAPSVDGTLYFLSERRWVYHVDATGTVLDVWDAVDPNPGARSTVTDIDVDAIGRVYVADPGMGRVRVYAPTPGLVPITPPRPSFLECETAPDKFAEPRFLQLGEKTKVTLRLNGNCPSMFEKADIMLVVDRSGSMEGEKIVAARAAVQTFVNLMDLGRDKVGMVAFQSYARLAVPLTQDRDRILREAGQLVPEGGTDITGAMDIAIDELLGPNHRPDAKPIIVLMTDGVPFNNSRMRTLASGDRARYAGITTYAIGLGLDVDPDLLRIVARVPELYYFAPTAADLDAVYKAIAKRIAASVLLKRVTIVDKVPVNMVYQEGSAVPPATWDAAGRTLTWTFQPVPFSGLEMSFWLEPLEVGEWPTNVKADYEGIDGLDQPESGIFPIPRVVVVAPDRPTPTHTFTPEPTVPPTATVTPTPTVPPTVPPTPTSRPGPIYVPIVFNNRCFDRHTDVVLIIDKSTTMRRKGADGRLKLEEAKDAARAFLQQLRFARDPVTGGYDQAAIVWFNNTARTEQTLTNDPAALLRAVDRIRDPIEGSRIDLGLSFAHQQMLNPRRRFENTPAIVLLSDGEPNRVSIEGVYKAADAIKRDRIDLFAVGFGADIREYALRTIASRPEHYYFSPDGHDLTKIYRTIAGKLVCR